MSARADEHTAVAEIQGLEGAFSFPERLLQRIWLRGDFDGTQAMTADGRSVKVIHPGRWNRLGGPDFFNAKIEIAGERVQGDVELHLWASDWAAHRHRDDPKYAGVVLHVVLFPPQAPTLGAGGKEIPVLALLPLLYRSLEEYAEEDAVERLANHPLVAAQEALLVLSTEEQRARLIECAQARWRQKVRFAEKRVAALGWREACHQTALEILGYRFNRGPMLSLATKYPLDCWPSVVSGDALGQVYLSYQDRWNRQAVRPANHPRIRLRQYGEWTAAVADWPEKLKAMFTSLSGSFNLTEPANEAEASRVPAIKETQTLQALNTAEFRKRVNASKLVERFTQEVCGGAVGGTRLQTLMADGFWPLLAALQTANEPALSPYWFNGYCGDLPEGIPRLLRALELTNRRTSPLCHGLAQGLLGWVWREEQRQQQTTAC